MDVHLLVYDLSNGLAKQLSLGLLGFQLDAIYHTSIELESMEYVYDSGINVIKPGTSHLGPPLERIHLGKSELPMEIIVEYLESLKEIYTPQAYDLFRHNCNNFSNDFSTFLVGKGIPDHIANMPNDVLDSPFGKMMQPQLARMVEERKAQQGGLLGIQNNVQPHTNGAASTTSSQNKSSHATSVKAVTSLSEMNQVLNDSKKTCAIVFFTMANCGPCRALYPLYDNLADEYKNKINLIKVDIHQAFDVSSKYNIKATPTFITFFHGVEDDRWTGADGAKLRGTVGLLAQMAIPSHPHQLLNLNHSTWLGSRPIIYEKVVPIPKLLSKLGSKADDDSIQGMIRFIEIRASQGPALAHLPDLSAFSNFMCAAVKDLPKEVLFTVVDLFRCTLADARVSGYFAEEHDHKTVLAILDAVNKDTKCPYALRLVTLQMASNLFSSHLYVDQILGHPQLRSAITQLISSSFLDDKHSTVRVAATSLLFNVASTNLKKRVESGDALPEEDQVELAASLLEAISQEDSKEALDGMILALGLMTYCLPLGGELVDLLRSMDAQGTVLAKEKVFKTDLTREVGQVLLGKGLARQ
ncbi:DUF862-domain-containing protein [Annulohypoxylon bovei var. microspora]|nr:DUF862-domain-containing protein [Annulohypoxylon bovei var. microspora]